MPLLLPFDPHPTRFSSVFVSNARVWFPEAGNFLWRHHFSLLLTEFCMAWFWGFLTEWASGLMGNTSNTRMLKMCMWKYIDLGTKAERQYHIFVGKNMNWATSKPMQNLVLRDECRKNEPGLESTKINLWISHSPVCMWYLLARMKILLWMLIRQEINQRTPESEVWQLR